MPNLSTFTGIQPYLIAERSEATPGLFNNLVSVVSQNLDQINSDAFALSAAAPPGALNAASLPGSGISQIQAAINKASALSIPIVYLPTSLLPYAASQISFIYPVQMVREGGDWSVYDVKAYGARGDGTGDDTAAIQQAIYAGVQKVVRMPSGAYPISSTITVPAYSHLIGDGRRIVGNFNISTLIQRYFTGTAFFAGAISETSRVNAIVMQGFTLDSRGTAGGYTGTGFDCRIASGLVFSDVEVFNNIGAALYLADTYDCVFDRFWVRQSGATNPPTPAILMDGIIDKVDRADFYSLVCENNYWTSCAINKGATGGRPKWVTFISPKFHDWQVITLTPGTPLLSVASAQALKIIGGQFSVFSSSGLSFAGDQCTIFGTQFALNNGATGLEVTGGSAGRFDGVEFITDDGNTPNSRFSIGAAATQMFVRYTAAGSATTEYVNTGTNSIVINDQTGLQNTLLGNLALSDGNMAIGGAPSTSRGLFVQSSNLSTGNQIGVASRPTFSSAAVNSSYALDVLPSTANATFTAATVGGIVINNPTRGAASSIGTVVGVDIASQSAGSNNFAIYTRTGTVAFGDVVGIVAGSATTPGLFFSSQSSLGWQRNGADWMTLSRGALLHPTGSAVSPVVTFTSEVSLGFYRSGASTIAQSYGTLWVVGEVWNSGVSGLASIASFSYVSSTRTVISGDVWTSTLSASVGLHMKSGTNKSCGTATLGSNGSVNVANTYVAANDLIFLTDQTPGGTLGDLELGGIRAGSGFTIQSTSITDTSLVGWLIVRPT